MKDLARETGVAAFLRGPSLIRWDAAPLLSPIEYVLKAESIPNRLSHGFGSRCLPSVWVPAPEVVWWCGNMCKFCESKVLGIGMKTVMACLRLECKRSDDADGVSNAGQMIRCRDFSGSMRDLAPENKDRNHGSPPLARLRSEHKTRHNHTFLQFNRGSKSSLSSALLKIGLLLYHAGS